MSDSPAVEPVETPLVVIHGDATDEEVAALLAVLQGLAPAGPAETAPPRRTSAWSSPARRLRTPVHPSPDGWRASGLPR